MKPIKIVIADDNRFFCEALKDSLQNHNSFKIVSTFTNLTKLIDFTKNHSFDLLILDINFKGINSLDYLDKIKSNGSFKIIALTTMNNVYIKNQALNKGVDCFVGKDSDFSAFKSTIISCFNNQTKSKIIKKNKFEIEDKLITKRKLQILQALYDYSENNEAEIAEKLFISKTTFKNHKTELFEITNTKNTPDLIRFGIKNGLIVV